MKKIKLDDGRVAEQIVTEHIDAASKQETRVTETWVEPKKLRLAGRTIEHFKSMVHKVEHQVIDEETGKVVKTKVDKLKHELEPGCCSSKKFALQGQVAERVANCNSMGVGKLAVLVIIGAEIAAVVWLAIANVF